jgi:hypothetical protein
MIQITDTGMAWHGILSKLSINTDKDQTVWMAFIIGRMISAGSRSRTL